MRKAVGESDFPKKLVDKTLKSDSFDLAACHEQGQAVGIIRAVEEGIYVTLVDIVVHPAAQHQGIGTALIKAAVQEKNSFQPEKHCTIQLISANDKESFYQQFGFIKIPNDFFGNGMQLKIRYEKE